MLKQNVDFFAVLLIAAAMLIFAQVRELQIPSGPDVIRLENAIDIEQCPLSRQVIANLSTLWVR